MKIILILLLAFGFAADCIGQTVIINSFMVKHAATPSPTPSAPAFVSATVAESGDLLTLVFNEPVTNIDGAYFTLTGDFTLTLVSGDSTPTVALAIESR